MNQLQDRVIVVTGAGRGLGREHALLLAAEGAKVVVDDTGSGPDGHGNDITIAKSVVDEIVAAGGIAVASAADVTTIDGASELLDLALEAFGSVDGLVNNAGILRDRMFLNMPEADWDDVISGQLRATFAPCTVFGNYWARAFEVRRTRSSVDCERIEYFRAARCRRSEQLRRREGRDRCADNDPRAGSRPIRCASQCNYPCGQDTDDRERPRHQGTCCST